MAEVLQLNSFPSGFLTRRQGEQVRSRLIEIEAKVPPAQKLVIDFSDVSVMTPSFADECFGKFAERIGGVNFRQRVSLRNANDTIRTLINSVLTSRLRTEPKQPTS